MKLCKDCETYGYFNGQRHICNDARNRFFDPVTGGYLDYDCSWLRSKLHEADGCGPQGKWWRPRNPEADPCQPRYQAETARSDAPPPNDQPAGKAKG